MMHTILLLLRLYEDWLMLSCVHVCSSLYVRLYIFLQVCMAYNLTIILNGKIESYYLVQIGLPFVFWKEWSITANSNFVPAVVEPILHNAGIQFCTHWITHNMRYLHDKISGVLQQKIAHIFLEIILKTLSWVICMSPPTA